MPEPDFKKCEIELINQTTAALKSFASVHEPSQFAYFAFDCNPDYGEVLLCLDTRENSIAEAKKTESRIIEELHKISYQDRGRLEWIKQTVANNTTGQRIVPFGNNTGDFSHQGFVRLEFPEWADFKFDDEYPGEWEESGADYLEAKLILMFSNVIHELVAQNAFSCLRIASPFYIGFAFHEGSQYVCRMINW